ncbi:MAG: hypothetical protein R3F21_07600 [Myxococcota bacterium]
MASVAPVARLARKLASLSERAMHWHVLLDALRTRSIDEAVDLVETILARPPTAGRRPDVLRLRMLEVLGGEAPIPDHALDYAFRRDLYAAAHVRGAESIQRHLRSLPELAAPEVLARRLPKDVGKIPLGRRRSLAKGDDPRLLEKLALDPDPVVLENLLRNPRMREGDVVRIAALRPIGAESLRRIDGETRWQASPRIRATIARNPFCPIDLAMKLVATLATPLLREIADDGGLAWPVREAILIELESRGETEDRDCETDERYRIDEEAAWEDVTEQLAPETPSPGDGP